MTNVFIPLRILELYSLVYDSRHVYIDSRAAILDLSLSAGRPHKDGCLVALTGGVDHAPHL
ncbi:MAG: hypothetical protein KJ907_13935 [Actinobacteria bacterium]|nr:hypothetical protein [Actinomycetota bacterium]MBU4403818.1 hypothetical protein [Actinomycetota bacterium]MCG2819597.1 hypothetical protein [Actinomycetes bacterium]